MEIFPSKFIGFIILFAIIVIICAYKYFPRWDKVLCIIGAFSFFISAFFIHSYIGGYIFLTSKYEVNFIVLSKLIMVRTSMAFGLLMILSVAAQIIDIRVGNVLTLIINSVCLVLFLSVWFGFGLFYPYLQSQIYYPDLFLYSVLQIIGGLYGLLIWYRNVN